MTTQAKSNSSSLADNAITLLDHEVEKLRGDIRRLSADALQGLGATVERQATVTVGQRTLTIRLTVETAARSK